MDVNREGKTYKINRDKLDVIRQIKALYKQGMDEQEVNRELRTQGVPVVVDQDKKTMATISQTFSAIQQQMNEQRAFNEKLMQRMDERDKNIVALMRELQANREELAAARKKPRWKFW